MAVQDVVREAAYRALVQVGKDRMHFRRPDEQNDHKAWPSLPSPRTLLAYQPDSSHKP